MQNTVSTRRIPGYPIGWTPPFLSWRANVGSVRPQNVTALSGGLFRSRRWTAKLTAAGLPPSPAATIAAWNSLAAETQNAPIAGTSILATCISERLQCAPESRSTKISGGGFSAYILLRIAEYRRTAPQLTSSRPAPTLKLLGTGCSPRIPRPTFRSTGDNEPGPHGNTPCGAQGRSCPRRRSAAGQNAFVARRWTSAGCRRTSRPLTRICNEIRFRDWT